MRHHHNRRAGFSPPPNRSAYKPSYSSPDQDISPLRQNGYRPFIHRRAEARPTSRFVGLSLRRAEFRTTSRFADVSLRRAEFRTTSRFAGVSLRRAEACPMPCFVELSLRRAEARSTSRFVVFLCGGLKPALRSASWVFLRRDEACPTAR